MSKEKGSGFRVCDCDSNAKRNPFFYSSYFAKRVFLPDDRLATTSGWSGPDVLISILFLGQLNFPNLMFHPCQASEPFDGIPGWIIFFCHSARWIICLTKGLCVTLVFPKSFAHAKSTEKEHTKRIWTWSSSANDSTLHYSRGKKTCNLQRES